MSTNDELHLNTFNNDISNLFDIDDTAKWIRDNGYDRISLQLPDHLLEHGCEISERLKQLTGKQIYISVDTTYSNCCVDEVSARHVAAEAIVHYGHACLSPCDSKLFYVHPKSALQIDQVVRSIKSIAETENVLLFYQTNYEHVSKALIKLVFEAYSHVLVAKIDLNNSNRSKIISGRVIVDSSDRIMDLSTIEQCRVIYIGAEDQTLFNLAISLKMQELFVVNPSTYVLKPYSESNWMKRRRYIIEKCKIATNIGILVCTLSIANFTSIISRLKELIKINGRRSFVLTVGKPNIAKLSNLYEMDVFVLIACPENDLYGCRDLSKPIAYPFELELALNKNRNEFTTDYITDFNNLLPDGSGYCDLDRNELESDVSLITGNIRSVYEHTEPESSTDRRLDTIRSEDWAVAELNISDSLLGRNWKGLEQKLGETKVEDVQKGRKGIAMGYEKEPT